MATFYFSTSGNNTTGDGSQALPWKTFIAKKSGNDQINPNDYCLFKRGDIWVAAEAEVVVRSSGTFGSPINMGAYGTGDPPTFAGAGITSSGFTYTGANSIYSIAGQSQANLRVVTQDDNKALGVWNGTQTTLPEGTFKRVGTTLFIRCWGNVAPSTASIRIANYTNSNYYRGLVRNSDTGDSRGAYIEWHDIRVICSNTFGITSSKGHNNFYDCIVMGTGNDAVDMYGYAPNSESASDNMWFRGEVSYGAAMGSGNGQGFTIGAPRVWVVDTVIHDNFMAGLDFLDYGSDTNVTECGALRCVVYNNARWQDAGGSWDPQIYVDGASEIFIYGCIVWGAGVTGGTANNAKSGITFGSEHPTSRPCQNIWIVNNLVFGCHWTCIQAGEICYGSTSECPTDGNTKPRTTKNIYIINNTLVTYDAGSFDMCLSLGDLNTTTDNIVIRNNIFVCDSITTWHWAGTGTNLLFDHNVYYRRNQASSSTNIYSTDGGTTNYNLAAWQATRTGRDTGAVYGNPMFILDSDTIMDAHLDPASPAIGIGMLSPYPVSVPSWLPAALFPYGTNVRGAVLASGVFENVATTLSAGFHYRSGEAGGGAAPPPPPASTPGAAPITYVENIIISGVNFTQ